MIKKVKRPAGWIGFSKHATDASHEEAKGDANSLAAGKFYGTGVKAKMGKVRTGTGIDSNPVSSEKLKKPPRSLA